MVYCNGQCGSCDDENCISNLINARLMKEIHRNNREVPKCAGAKISPKSCARIVSAERRLEEKHYIEEE